MEIYLVRHGIAEDVSADGSDASRRLTKEGWTKTQRVAKALRKRLTQLDLIYHSPYTRAEETAQIFIREFPEAKATSAPSLTPRHSAEAALSLLRGLENECKVMLVGHEPHLSSLASLLLTGRNQPILEFKKSGVAAIQCGKGLHLCHLQFLLSPKWL